ncbi:MAG TPA: type II toxin-antitoxin system prevent-host-death family antitoxin [Longimicrobium sp.]|jgi:prevent-host-death family protein
MSKNAMEITDYGAELEALVEKAANGEEVLITRGGEPVAQIVPLEPKEPREFGSGRGMIVVPPDFDEPLEDFAEYR